MKVLKVFLFMLLGVYRLIVFIPVMALGMIIGFGCTFRDDEYFVSDMLSVLFLDSIEERIKQL